MNSLRTTGLDFGSTAPQTLPLSVEQFACLVDAGKFDHRPGQIELINGRLVHMNPQGPQHADPVDLLEAWSHRVAGHHYRIRIEKPIMIEESDSLLEPDVAWVTQQSYARRHPNPEEVFLLIEVSHTSVDFDLGEKLQVYALAGIREYWQVNVNARQLRAHRGPADGIYQDIQTISLEQSISPECLPSASLAIADLFD